jgi:enoyl-CoA hydratase/carnithine racemase
MSLLAMGKAAVKSAARLDLRAGMDAQVDRLALCFSSESRETGVQAFLEKRLPTFKEK